MRTRYHLRDSVCLVRFLKNDIDEVGEMVVMMMLRKSSSLGTSRGFEMLEVEIYLPIDLILS